MYQPPQPVVFTSFGWVQVLIRGVQVLIRGVRPPPNPPVIRTLSETMSLIT